jgi:uncharacterized protein YbjT (DUF2867 family)
MEKGKDVILVTGATGNQGSAVARELLSRGHKVRAMTRKPEGEAAKALAALGAEVVKGDLDDVASLERALDGAWGVFGVQNTWEAGVEGEETQGKRLAEVAKKKGVQHFVYSSVGSAHRKTGIPHFDNKWRVEEAIRGMGLPSYTILRPVFFMENWVSPWFKPAIDEGNVAIGIKPDTKLQMIAVKDIGQYGAIAFERHAELARPRRSWDGRPGRSSASSRSRSSRSASSATTSRSCSSGSTAWATTPTSRATRSSTASPPRAWRAGRRASA